MIKWNSLYNTSPNLEIVENLKIRHLLLCLLFASKFGDLRGIKLTSSAAFLKKKPHNQTWANNSTGDCYSSITRRLDNNSCKYTWQSMVITRLEPNSSNHLAILLRLELDLIGWEFLWLPREHKWSTYNPWIMLFFLENSFNVNINILIRLSADMVSFVKRWILEMEILIRLVLIAQIATK